MYLTTAISVNWTIQDGQALYIMHFAGDNPEIYL
jgi:hypothetical protein